MVEGAVESVSVNLGQTVKANDLLAIIHSREVGDAKLALIKRDYNSKWLKLKIGFRAKLPKMLTS